MVKLNNRYFALRHGESVSNTKKIINSNPETGRSHYGLTDNGMFQVYKSVSLSKINNNSDIIIYSSEFLRAIETGDIASEILDVDEGSIIILKDLNERYFGEFEGELNENYECVWNLDKNDPQHKKYEVESVCEVYERAKSLIDELEEQYSGKIIILASHGDILQILQTYFDGKNPKNHRDPPPLENAELRELKYNSLSRFVGSQY